MLEAKDVRTNVELLRHLEMGGDPEYHFFWEGPFSQWHPSPFYIDGIRYPTAEHWMMAEKARLFQDDDALLAILVTAKPREAKAIGREIAHFDVGAWGTICMDKVVIGNCAKFHQNPELWEVLANTGDAVLVEASPEDRIWGIGIGVDEATQLTPYDWKGTNRLGYAIMRVRSILV